MQYLTLVVDYDGTIAQNSKVPESTKEAMKHLARSGRKIILCTGREIRYLLPDFPELEIFDIIVAENGGVLYHPKTREEKALAEPRRASSSMLSSRTGWSRSPSAKSLSRRGNRMNAPCSTRFTGWDSIYI
jgi:HAD superfamily hydrolase (TIGR01484 family)